MRDKRWVIIITSVALEKQNSILYEGRFEKTQYILNSKFGLYFSPPKKYKNQSKNIIMCCEFDAKLRLDAQNVKQFWYRASALEFLLIAHAHLTTHGHTNSSTHIWYPERWRSSSHSLNAHLMARTSLICIFICFFIFLFYKIIDSCIFQ